MGKKVSDVNIDDLLDDEGWSLLNELTEEELELLNADFDPESLLTPIIGRKFDSTQNGPMFKKEDLVENLERIVAESIPVIKNEKIRKKEEVKKQEKEEQLKRQYSRDRPDLVPQRSIALTEEEEDLLNNATEEELIEAAEDVKQDFTRHCDGLLALNEDQDNQSRKLRMSSSITECHRVPHDVDRKTKNHFVGSKEYSFFNEENESKSERVYENFKKLLQYNVSRKKSKKFRKSIFCRIKKYNDFVLQYNNKIDESVRANEQKVNRRTDPISSGFKTSTKNFPTSSREKRYIDNVYEPFQMNLNIYVKKDSPVKSYRKRKLIKIFEKKISEKLENIASEFKEISLRVDIRLNIDRNNPTGVQSATAHYTVSPESEQNDLDVRFNFNNKNMTNENTEHIRRLKTKLRENFNISSKDKTASLEHFHAKSEEFKSSSIKNSNYSQSSASGRRSCDSGIGQTPTNFDEVFHDDYDGIPLSNYANDANYTSNEPGREFYNEKGKLKTDYVSENQLYQEKSNSLKTKVNKFRYSEENFKTDFHKESRNNFLVGPPFIESIKDLKDCNDVKDGSYFSNDQTLNRRRFIENETSKKNSSASMHVRYPNPDLITNKQSDQKQSTPGPPQKQGALSLKQKQNIPVLSQKNIKQDSSSKLTCNEDKTSFKNTEKEQKPVTKEGNHSKKTELDRQQLHSVDKKSNEERTCYKSDGLKALDEARGKLRKIVRPDPEKKENEAIEERLSKSNCSATEENIKKKDNFSSPLNSLLQKDSEALDKKKQVSEKVEQADHRGVSSALLQQALLKMNGILTNEQISSVWAGEKPKGSSIRTSSSVKATEQKKCITAADEETELDVVELMRCCREDTDDLFYICINNQPNLERQIKLEVIKTVEQSLKVRHLSMAMTGLIDFEVKELATALRYNTRLETLNLESNIITMHGILVLMAEVGRHPSLREVKISNQKQPFGLQGEECMAAAIDKNENIIKFGYSFMQPGPRNKADRAIIRHNENLRQRRKNGEDVYDLKVVSKIRDEWPQPWIKVKGRRGLEKLIENKVMDMGHMDSSNTDKKGLKETSPAPVGAFNIKDLLAQRKATLQCANIEELEKEQERKRKQHFQEMEEYNKNNKSHDIVSKREDDKPYNNHSNGVENVIKRTTQAPKSVTQAPKSGETRGININELLTQRQAMLKSSKLEDLEREQERKRKEQFKEMEEFNKKGKIEDANNEVLKDNRVLQTKHAKIDEKNSKGSFSTNRTANGFSVNELLSQQKALIKGNKKIAELEKEQERKRKEQFKAMEEFDKSNQNSSSTDNSLQKTAPKNSDSESLVTVLSETKQKVVDDNHNSRSNPKNVHQKNETFVQDKSSKPDDNSETYVPPPHTTNELKKSSNNKIEKNDLKPSDNHSSNKNPAKKEVTIENEKLSEENKLRDAEKKRNLFSNSKKIGVEALQKTEISDTKKNEASDSKNENLKDAGKKEEESKKLVDEKKKVDESEKKQILDNKIATKDAASHSKSNVAEVKKGELDKLKEQRETRKKEEEEAKKAAEVKKGELDKLKEQREMRKKEEEEAKKVAEVKKGELDKLKEQRETRKKEEEEAKKAAEVKKGELDKLKEQRETRKKEEEEAKKAVEVKKGELDKLKEQRETRKKEEEEAKKAAEVKKGELDKLKEQREMRKKEEEEAKKVAEVKKGELDKLKEQRETRKKEEEEAKKAAEVKKGELDKLKEQRETRKKEEEEAKKAAEVKKGELDKLKEQREMRKKEEEEAKKLAEERKKEKEVENNIKLPLDTKNVGKKDIGSSSKGEKIELKKDQFIKQKEQSDGKKNFTEEKGRVDLIEKNPKLLFENKNSINKDSISRSKGDVAEPKKGDFDKLKEQSEARKKEEVAKKVLEEKKKAEEPESKTKLSSGSKYVDLKGTAEVTSSFKGNAAELKKGELDKSKEQREVLKKEEVKKVAEEKTKSKEDENKQKLLSVNKNVANADAASNLKGAANMQKGELDKTKEQREARIKEEETKKKAEEAEKETEDAIRKQEPIQ